MTPLLIIAFCVGAGVLLNRFNLFADNASQTLNQYVIWIALPALIVANISGFTLSSAVFVPMLVAWTMLLLSAAMVLAVHRIFNWDKSTRCVLLLLVPLGNTSFVGIPLISALLGEQGVPYAILYDQLGTFLGLATYGTLVIALHSDVAADAKSITKKVLTFPPFIALVIGVLLSFTVGLDHALKEALAAIGKTLVPVVMVAVGLQWRFRLEAADRAPLFVGLGIKLLIAPAIAWLLIRTFDFDPLLEQVLVLEAAMPPMISAGALATMHNQRPSLAAGMVGYGLLFGFATVPLWSWLLQ